MLSRNQQHLDVDTPRRDPEANVQGYQPPLGSLGFLSEILLIPDVHCEKIRYKQFKNPTSDQ